MKQFFGLLFAFFALSYVANAQVFWTEDFGAGACNQGQLASDYAGANGAWTVTQTGTNGDLANVWYISAQEQGGQGDGGCGTGCAGDMNNTLHVGNIEFTFLGNTLPADPGAAYGATGGFIAGSSAETDVRAESPTIDCTGKSSITLSFLYMEGLNGTDADPIDDNADVWYFDGTTWALLDDPVKTPNTCAPQGTWTAYSFALPASADNNPNVKIGFHWINDDDDSATDPSFAVDDITLSTAENLPVALFEVSADTTCIGVGIQIDNLSQADTTTMVSIWDFDGGVADLTDPDNPVNVTWDSEGTYVIELTVSDTNGVSVPYMDTILVEDCSPVASFTLNPMVLCIGDSTEISNTSTFEGLPGSVTWAWDFDNGQESSLENPGYQTYNAAGVYSIQLIATDTFGADTSTLQLNVFDCSVPNALFFVADTNICANSSLGFVDQSLGSNISDWQWTFDGGIPASFNGQNPGAVIYPNTGTYTATLVITDDNGTSQPYSQEIVVTTCVTTEVVIEASDTTLCPGDTIVFTDGSTGINITAWDWVFEGGTPATSTEQNPGEVYYTTTGVYNAFLTITDDNGTTTDSITIYVNSLPTISIVASATEVCSTQTVTLVATGGTPTWDGGVQNGVPFVPPLGSTTYTATIVEPVTGCVNTDEIVITATNCIPPTSIFASSATSICVGDCIDFSDFSTNADTIFWDFGSQASPSSYVGLPNENVQVCFDTSGTYIVTQTAVNEFGDDMTIQEITVSDGPELVIPTSNYSVDYGNSVTISANSFDNVTYSWSPPQTLDNPISQSPTATPEEATIYTVTITDENNCTTSGEVSVEVIFTIGMGMPTVFSPEAEAPNNTFGPLGYGFEVHKFVIFNRYGQKVFETQTAGDLWDGTMNGKRLNSGTFFWSLEYTLTGETRKSIKGQVSLLH